MNKKELAMVEKLKMRLALRFTGDEPIAPDVPPPSTNEGGNRLTTGYIFNAYSLCVDVACSSSVYHSRGRTDRTNTQGSIRLYSNKALALRAMRQAVEMECAKKLRLIDIRIEAEDTKEV